jgi:hypothetical integral membrane protein (TIGR02206 family)
MSRLQIGFIAFTFCAPPMLWLLSRKVRSPRLARGVCTTFAVILVLAYAAALAIKAMSPEGVAWDTSIPMHLCDWAAVVTLIALIHRNPLAFELAYCWGLAGTAQALFTPAIDVNTAPGVIPFFVVHSIIPASVLWLLFEFRMRPRPGAYWRVMLWSEVYLAIALLTNRYSDGNYGFLAGRPSAPSVLDYYSDTPWIYVAQINLTAAIVFAILLIPWEIARKVFLRKQPCGLAASTSKTSGTSDARL